jgi:hypothetical protein
MGFEPTVPASARAKTVHPLDRSATVTGKLPHYIVLNRKTIRKNEIFPKDDTVRALKEWMDGWKLIC